MSLFLAILFTLAAAGGSQTQNAPAQTQGDAEASRNGALVSDRQTSATRDGSLVSDVAASRNGSLVSD